VEWRLLEGVPADQVHELLRIAGLSGTSRREATVAALAARARQA